jgi:hypothetical protein
LEKQWERSLVTADGHKDQDGRWGGGGRRRRGGEEEERRRRGGGEEEGRRGGRGGEDAVKEGEWMSRKGGNTGSKTRSTT